MVYRFAAQAYRSVLETMGRLGQLDDLAATAAHDFEMTRSSVLDELAARSVGRRRPTVGIEFDQDQPMFAHAEDEVLLVVTASPQDSTVAVTINLYFTMATADQLVAVSQSMYGRPATKTILRTRLASPENPSGTSTTSHSIQEVHSRIADYLNITPRQTASCQFRCAEIRQTEALTTAREAIDTYLLPLYGVLTADEGWRHVEQDVARSRLASVWTTRDFVAAISLGETVLVLNFRPDAYGAAQNAYFRRHFDHIEPYFSHRYRLAGLEHGPFLAMELCAYRKCVADDLRRRLAQRRAIRMSVSPLGNVRQQARHHSLYRALVEELARLRDHPPTELGALVNVIEADSGLPQLLADLRQEVQAVETEEQTVYLYRVNQLLVIVAWIGIVVAVVGLLIATTVAR